MHTVVAMPPQAPRADAAPDWSLVHFDVNCARCGHDLRGQTEPTCPACDLKFAWTEAVPLEELTCAVCAYHLYGLNDPRCPECGQPFDWDDALLRYRRRQKPLFEYRWRERPIRSLIHTWWLAFHPRRLWRSVDMHDPTNFAALGLMALISAIAAIIIFSIGIGINDWLSHSGLWFWSIPQAWQSPAQFLSFFVDLPGYISSRFLDSGIYESVFAFAIWWLNSLFALLIFRQSMRLYKVRAVHVVRVVAYSVVLPSPVVASAMVLIAWFGALSNHLQLGFIQDYIVTILGVCFFCICWSIRQGYRHYLIMPHCVAVALASQVIAVLATMSVFAIMSMLFVGL